MAFAKSTQARLPHFPGYPGTFTTLQTSFHNADRPVAPPRFDPGLSTGPGSFTTEDLGVSPDRTFTGWLTRVIARLRHDHSFAVVVIAPEQLDARGFRFIRRSLLQPRTTPGRSRALDAGRVLRDRQGGITTNQFVSEEPCLLHTSPRPSFWTHMAGTGHVICPPPDLAANAPEPSPGEL